MQDASRGAKVIGEGDDGSDDDDDKGLGGGVIPQGVGGGPSRPTEVSSSFVCAT